MNIKKPSSEVVEEMEWAAIRAKRNQLITDTDYTQIGDSPLSVEQKTAFSIFRQELRDLPQNFASSKDVVWPVKPE